MTSEATPHCLYHFNCELRALQPKKRVVTFSFGFIKRKMLLYLSKQDGLGKLNGAPQWIILVGHSNNATCPGRTRALVYHDVLHFFMEKKTIADLTFSSTTSFPTINYCIVRNFSLTYFCCIHTQKFPTMCRLPMAKPQIDFLRSRFAVVFPYVSEDTQVSFSKTLASCYYIGLKSLNTANLKLGKCHEEMLI